MTSTLLASTAVGATPVGDTGAHHASRIVVIDPRPERGAITKLVVERCDALTVVGLAATLGDAEPLIRTEQAAIVLLEIQMPVPEGLATIAALRDRFPDLRIVVCSFQSDATTREAARASGADGYLSKPLHLGELLTLLASPRSNP